MHELYGGKTPMGVDALRNGVERRQVAVVPESSFVGRCQVRCRMNLRFLGGDDGPTAFRLHAAQMGFRIGVAVAHAGTVGHLIETVACRDGANLDGLEENIEAGISGHVLPS